MTYFWKCHKCFSSQWARKFKKLVKSNKSKKFFFVKLHFFGSFKLFPSSKIDFWPILKWQKMEFSQKIFREIVLFDLTTFFGLHFIRFSGPLCTRTYNIYCTVLVFFHYAVILFKQFFLCRKPRPTIQPFGPGWCIAYSMCDLVKGPLEGL